MLYSENVYGYQLEKFREVFGCPILSHYGHSERVLMAASMPDDDRYFFWPQYGHFELLDADNRPVTQPGKLGFIVGTSFDNEVMPFVRYRTGDLGDALGRAAIRCCRAIPRASASSGACRNSSSAATTGWCRSPRSASRTSRSSRSVEAIQYEQERPGQVVLKVVAETAAHARTSASASRAAVAAQDAGRLRRAKWCRSSHIARTPRGKARMLVQHLDIRRYFGAATEA